MRISDWSSDVCSSDLQWRNGQRYTRHPRLETLKRLPGNASLRHRRNIFGARALIQLFAERWSVGIKRQRRDLACHFALIWLDDLKHQLFRCVERLTDFVIEQQSSGLQHMDRAEQINGRILILHHPAQIGRASRRERVCKYV